jgi:hypothetical protein
MQTGAFLQKQGKYPAPLVRLKRFYAAQSYFWYHLTPNLRPKNALMRLLIDTLASGGHLDSAACQMPVFGRAAEAWDAGMAVVFAFALG